MTYINVVYDDIYDDVDIIAIPDELANNLDDIIWNLREWNPPDDDSDYWTEVDGIKCRSLNTEGIVKWLNNYYCDGYQKVYIVKQNVALSSGYPIIEF